MHDQLFRHNIQLKERC